MNTTESDDHATASSQDDAIEESATEDEVATSTVQAELEEARAKVEENWNLFLSARAETENLRKRLERDVVNAHKFALEKFVAELLPVKDSIELGLSAALDTADVAKLIEGNEATLRQMAAAMSKFGVEEVDPLGDKFNPEVHEAMAMQPAADAEPNTVLQVVQKGYLLNARLVRPAMVIVAQSSS